MVVSGFLGTFIRNVWRGLRIGFHRFEAGFFNLQPSMRKPDDGGEGDQRVQPRENVATTRIECRPPVFDGNVVETCGGDEIGIVGVVAQHAMDAAVR